MKIHAIIKINGTFLIQLELMLDSEVVGTWNFTCADKMEGVTGVCYQCLKYLSEHVRFASHFTNNILDPKFSILKLMVQKAMKEVFDSYFEIGKLYP